MIHPGGPAVSSMTGFSEARTPDGYRIQLRSYNHRSLEVVCRIPAEWESLEPVLRKLLSQRIARGRVDIYIHRKDPAGQGLDSFLEQGVRSYRNLLLLSQHLGLSPEIRLEHLLQAISLEGTAETKSVDERTLLAEFENALEGLLLSRSREGQELWILLSEFIARMRSLSQVIDTQRKGAGKEIRRQFLDRMTSYLKEVETDQSKRYEEEALLYLAKKDNEEEWKRFHIHLAQAEREMEKGGLLGRSLDFLAQEMNRELTTFISKEPSPVLFQPAMEIRNVLASFREQIQNLE